MIAPLRSLLLPLYAGSIALAAPTLTLDLASPPPGSKITRIHGHGKNNAGALGVPVCGGHDCDGDGHRDFAFAQFQGDPLGRSNAGEVTIIFGDGTIGGSKDSDIAQAGILLIAGAQDDENAGSETWMDDLTGDGLGDLLIARQNYSLELPAPAVDRRGAGALTILVGSPGWKTHAAGLTPLDLASPPAGIQLITFVGPSAWDRLGIWVRSGDITGDGIADLAVGADEVDANGQSVTHNQGAVFVIRGGPHLLQSPTLVDLANFGQPTFPTNLKGHVARIDPPTGSSNFHFGATLQVADLDSNGRAEVIVAAALSRAGAQLDLPDAPGGTGEASGGSENGTVYIIWDENFPPGLWPETHQFGVDSPPFGDFTIIEGDGPARNFGEELIGGLDFSGDGFPELMIGDLSANNAAGRGHLFYNAGNLRGLDFEIDSPPPGIAITTINGPIAGSISSDTILQGDFDGDGIADLAIGNPHDDPEGRADAGSVHVLYGQPGGWPTTIDLHPNSLPDPDTMRIALIQGATGSAPSTVTTGIDSGDTLCYSAAAGDINNDGRPDLIVNEMAADGVGGTPEDVGNMIIIDATSLLDPFIPTLSASLPSPLDFGTALVSSGAPTKEITWTNTSGGPVEITSLTLSGPAAAHFEITADSGQSTLAAGETRTLTLTYDPSVVERSGAAIVIQTNTDPHSTRLGLTGRGIETASTHPDIFLHIFAGTAFLEVPNSQFGTDYTLLRSPDLTNPAPLLTLPGNGQTLYLTDPNALSSVTPAFYRVTAQREWEGRAP